jgi:hypothetical protein
MQENINCTINSTLNKRNFLLLLHKQVWRQELGHDPFVKHKSAALCMIHSFHVFVAVFNKFELSCDAWYFLLCEISCISANSVLSSFLCVVREHQLDLLLRVVCLNKRHHHHKQLEFVLQVPKDTTACLMCF